MQEKWSLRFIRIAALFGFVGAALGAHMAGSGSHAFKPVHAHILLVGWLSLFSWGIFYKVYQVRARQLIAYQGWTGIIGAIGLSIGMWLQYLRPFDVDETLALIFYIIGGTILLASFALFVIVTLFIHKKGE